MAPIQRKFFFNTGEQARQEFKKCKQDPLYWWNNYGKPDGTPKLTRLQYDIMVERVNEERDKPSQSEFKSSHDLPFLSKHWDNPFNTEGWQQFLIGTCHGQWISTPTSYDILTVINDQPGNGHFTDVLEWFERSCKRDGKAFRILEVWNKRLSTHLVTKHGFTYQDGDNLIKTFV